MYNNILEPLITDAVCHKVFDQNVIEESSTLFDDINFEILNFNSDVSISSSDCKSISLSSCLYSAAACSFQTILMRFSSENIGSNESINLSRNSPKPHPVKLNTASPKSMNVSDVFKGDTNIIKDDIILTKRPVRGNLNLLKIFNCFKPKTVHRKSNKVESSLLLKKFVSINRYDIVIENKGNSAKKRRQQISTLAPQSANVSKLKMEIPIKKETENLLFVASRMSGKQLLGPQRQDDRNKKCCVIDLDETLVHSSFVELPDYDFKVSVEIEGSNFDIFILKRPYVDIFLQRMGQLFECVLFTASLGKYANRVANILDKDNIFHWRLFREACVYYRGGFVKDLTMLGRPLEQIVILDNSPMSFLFNIKNAVHIISWFSDPSDRALLDIIPFCERLSNATSVIKFLQTEQPPATAALPLNPQIMINSQMSSTSKMSIPSTSSVNKNDLNPITNVSPDLDPLFVTQLKSKRSSRTTKRNHSDKTKSPSVASIRAFMPKAIAEHQMIAIAKSSSSSLRSKAVSDFVKSSQTRTSTSSTKDNLMRTSVRNSVSQGVAFNSSIKQPLDSTN